MSVAKETSLWVGNCTQSHLKVFIRVPEVNQAVEVNIPPLGQREVPNNGLSRETVDIIVAPYEKHYGWIHQSKVKSVKEFIGACWDYQKIDMERVGHAHELNMAIKEKWADERLDKTLIIADKLLQQNTQGTGQVDTLSVIEVKPKGERGLVKQRIIGGRSMPGERH